MVSKKTVNTLLAGAVAATMAGGIGFANTAQAAEKEKCYGVVKAGQNDCANAAKTHSCAGQSTVDADGGEWVSVPAGLCEKLVGGHTSPVEDGHNLDHQHEGHSGEDHGKEG